MIFLYWILCNNITKNNILLLDYAFKTWENYNQNVKFIRTTQDLQIENLIKVSFFNYSHGDDFPFDGKGNILAHSTLSLYSKQKFIHFDSSEYWCDQLITDNCNTDSKFLLNVALHEIGHVLGLYHSNKKTSIMYTYYNKLTKLSSEDILESKIVLQENPNITFLRKNLKEFFLFLLLS